MVFSMSNTPFQDFEKTWKITDNKINKSNQTSFKKIQHN